MLGSGLSAVTRSMLPGRCLLLVLSIVAVSLDSASAPNSTPVPCTDKAANFWSEGPQYSWSNPGVNSECEYTCRVLRSRFGLDASGIIGCYIERAAAGSRWPPGPVNQATNTFAVPAGTTVIVQGKGGSLTSRIDAINASLILRFVRMVGLVDPPDQPTWSTALHVNQSIVARMIAAGFYIPTNRVGGAVYVHLGNLTVEHCIFANNRAVDTGGVIAAGGNVGRTTINSCIFEGNLVAPVGDGGAVALDDRAGSVRITGSLFKNNSAGVGRDNSIGGGGAVSISGSTCAVEITESVFEGNRAAGTGGALVIDTSSSVMIYDSDFVNNSISGPQYWLGEGTAVHLGKMELAAVTLTPAMLVKCRGEQNRLLTHGPLSPSTGAQDTRSSECVIGWAGCGSACLTEDRLRFGPSTEWSFVSLGPSELGCQLPPSSISQSWPATDHGGAYLPGTISVGDQRRVGCNVTTVNGSAVVSHPASGVAKCVASGAVAMLLWKCECPVGQYQTAVPLARSQTKAACAVCPPHSTAAVSDARSFACTCDTGYQRHTDESKHGQSSCVPIHCHGPPIPNARSCTGAFGDGRSCAVACAPDHILGWSQGNSMEVRPLSLDDKVHRSDTIYNCGANGRWVPHDSERNVLRNKLVCYDPCKLTISRQLTGQRCLHGGTCEAVLPNISADHGHSGRAYLCHCRLGYVGTDCENTAASDATTKPFFAQTRVLLSTCLGVAAICLTILSCRQTGYGRARLGCGCCKRRPTAKPMALEPFLASPQALTP